MKRKATINIVARYEAKFLRQHLGNYTLLADAALTFDSIEFKALPQVKLPPPECVSQSTGRGDECKGINIDLDDSLHMTTERENRQSQSRDKKSPSPSSSRWCVY